MINNNARKKKTFIIIYETGANLMTNHVVLVILRFSLIIMPREEGFSCIKTCVISWHSSESCSEDGGAAESMQRPIVHFGDSRASVCRLPASQK